MFRSRSFLSDNTCFEQADFSDLSGEELTADDGEGPSISPCRRRATAEVMRDSRLKGNSMFSSGGGGGGGGLLLACEDFGRLVSHLSPDYVFFFFFFSGD